MFQKKSRQLKVSQQKSTLDQVLWFIENYLPNKKRRYNRKELRLDILEAEILNQIQRFVSSRSKLLNPKQKNTKI